MRAILVSVDFADILAYTLPWNRHHFTDVMVVTSCNEKDNLTVKVAESQDCNVYRTDTFFAMGAKFNKWGALEEALDLWGRKPCFPTSSYAQKQGYLTPTSTDNQQPHLDHWLCLMDADILWPRDLVIGQSTNLLTFNSKISSHSTLVQKGQLCSPIRRMFSPDGRLFFHNGELSPIHVLDNLEGTGLNPEQVIGCTRPFPQESGWKQYPIHRNVAEWAGYSQIFHLEDPMLPTPPWHDTQWVHAGGADSFFQMRWPTHLKVRPFWECLHIGESGMNWMGRQSHYLNGQQNPLHHQKHEEIMSMWRERRRREREYKGNQGEIFRPEKLPPE